MFTSMKFFILLIIMKIVFGQLNRSSQKECLTIKDCQQENTICEQKFCICSAKYILVNGKCLPKIKPGQSPCLKDEQCRAFWPNTRCLNTICQCTIGVPVLTRDGIVCVDSGQCPLGGSSTILRDSTNQPVVCSNGQEAFRKGCLDQLHMYDCLTDHRNNSLSFCCPNKANVCNQKLDPGHLMLTALQRNAFRYDPSSISQQNSKTIGAVRYYKNSANGKCENFTYLGEGGNANNFLSLEQCESFCLTACPRGNPLFQNNENSATQQYSQRQQICDPIVGCSDPRFKCTEVTGHSICCPTKEFICENGGLPKLFSHQAFDQGVHCSSKSKSSVRFYFEKRFNTCQPFDYKGCGGNFNNFNSLEECTNFCIS